MKKVVKNMFLVTKGGPQNSGLHALIRMGAPLVITLHTSLICAGNGWGCHFAMQSMGVRVWGCSVQSTFIPTGDFVLFIVQRYKSHLIMD